jgi:hypothetical protein
MYLADIASSLQFCLKKCAGWGARSIMAEVFPEGNVEKVAAISYQSSAGFETQAAALLHHRGTETQRNAILGFPLV